MKEDEVEARVGTVIRDKWTLVRLLGTGGMAAVYVGVHRIGRRDALKILHREAAKSKEVCLRFEREAQAVNRFRHPGAVEIRDIDVTEDGAPFLVMELLVGESLGDRVTRLGKLPVGEVLRHAEQVLDVLTAAHAQGIIHRDIKPANLFQTSEGRLKVLDFGLARIHEGGLVDGLHTKEGATLGTTPYMPPEQAKGRPIDHRADVFSVGATMFRMLTGRYLHDASGAFDLLMKQARDPAPPILRHAPSLPATVAAIVDRALSFDREQRYPSAATMLEDVRSVLRGGAPTHAQRMSGGIDRLASTHVDIRAIESPPAATRDAASADQAGAREPGSTAEIPIYLSGFSGIDQAAAGPSAGVDVALSEGESTDREPAPERKPEPSRQLETTLISAGNTPSEKPKP